MKELEVNIELAIKHGLTEKEYQKVLDKLGRVPTFTELGIISVMWSEHASYKNSIKYIKTLPKEGEYILSKAGEENAGVIDIGDGLAIAFKIESHNHPSAIEPYLGAATGVGGILRDIFTMGAKPFCALNSLRLGNYTDPETKHLLHDIVAGIADYGNVIGVPVVGGEVYFENSYQGNPLVNAMAVGVLEHQKMITASAKSPGNDVVYFGAKTGRDGIHGSTFASQELNDEAQSKKSSVAIGDPIVEKRLLEATLELIAKDLVEGMQDMGAAGLTCTTSEMSAKAGLGIEIDVALVPLGEEGMTPYEIMLSESQERMLMVVKPENLRQVEAIIHKWDLSFAKIGVVTNDQLLRVKNGSEIKAELPSNFLVLGGEAPVYDRELQEPSYFVETRAFQFESLPIPDDFNIVLKRLVSTPNIASKKAVYIHFHHQTEHKIHLGPGGDAALIQIPGSSKGLALTTDCNGRHVYLDAYEGTKGAVAEAARNIICTGAKPIGISNNLNFGNPYKPEVYWNFVHAIRGIKDACEKFYTPVTGGNVSFYNENPHSAIFPTPTIGMVGIIDDLSKALSIEFVNQGDIIYLLGDHCHEVGGSEYQKMVSGKPLGMPPMVDLEQEKILHQTMLTLVENRILQSAHDCSDGGLAVALLESCFQKEKNIGCKIDFPLLYRPDIELFGESSGRIIVSLSKANESKFIDYCQKHGCKIINLGFVTAERFVIQDYINCDLYELRELYEKGIVV